MNKLLDKCDGITPFKSGHPAKREHSELSSVEHRSARVSAILLSMSVVIEVWHMLERANHFEATAHHVPTFQIISLEQFNRAQEIRRKRHKLPPRSVLSPFILSGVLHCIYCEARMVGMRQYKKRANGDTKEWQLYTCGAYHSSGATTCRGQMISESLVRRAVLPFFVEIL